MKRFLIVLAALAALPAWAERNALPTGMPAAYQSECGSCHTPFPPGLLSAADWKATMAGLEDHFGTDASLDAKSAGAISAWLETNASRRIQAAGKPPRLTTTAWFKREHREVPTKAWQDSRVKSAANCAACHRGADQGRYGEREIDIPGIGRWED
ncbi:cytochrome C [Parasulfuritortus cantonensis]|uniref:Cytochrome C n=1 Tax=Parasulfuritortus cantonensis TaxID=2528202 RepID=A0A4R1BF43_9PROT|nr:diheme cytochrome c [Parasulfuritortus cantonensis]TCJ15795.1 cytochrome C [Parasulfuritortus cantonensis]